MHVSVTPIAFEKMSEILHGPVAILPPPPPMALLQTPPDQERPLRRPLLPQVPDRELGPDFPQGIRPRPGFPRGERPRMDGPYPGGRPPMERPMRHPHGRMRGPFPNRPLFFNGPSAQTSDPVCFGAPGCVVSVNNLHFRATLENVLEFFKDYKLSKDSVIRRFNENKQVTGEARVAFQSPRDAQKAVRELNHKSIMGRSLSLALL
ncbi:hypothetical protein CEXT_552491 [Caerostris extrusa]|uniref:RRM domain-containing protein n=1 Tax=Caerostris extrusa TaxID=172846 RepID=A0AAV4N8L4_CAEEX|nr:hypothetical protein CEXT_552491 [Caerostris extrusa]